MNRIDIAYGVVFKALDIKKDTFDDRLISQKKIYLLQMLGTDLGYRFVWYVRGPYSKELTSYIYENDDRFDAAFLSKYKLADEVQKRIEKINLLAQKKSKKQKLADWYELLSSLLFIYQNKSAFSIEDGTDDDVIWALGVEKPNFEKQKKECERALDLLKNEGFI